MKPLLLALTVSVLLANSLVAQSAQQLENYLRNNPAADTNGDGSLSVEEARAHRQMRRDPSAGDNANSVSSIPGIKVSLTDSPIQTVALETEDGVDLSFAYRKPAGEGPFPTIIFLHGGGGSQALRGLESDVKSGTILTRFLDKGYLIVAATRRPYWASREAGRPHGFYAAVEDTKTILAKVAELPGVDASRISLYGGSGGGILAIVTASGSDVASVIAGEPATVIPLDPRTGQQASPKDYQPLMEDPLPKYEGEIREQMRAWMEGIDCPVLILQGNPVGLYKTNFELLIPEMKALGKDIQSITYPGLSHGFYWGNARTGATLETVEKVIADSLAFLEPENPK